jgi:hypothetical protein
LNSPWQEALMESLVCHISRLEISDADTTNVVYNFYNIIIKRTL